MTIGVTSAHQGVDVIIEDKCVVTGFYDTGASHTLMSQKLAERAGIRFSNFNENFKGVGSEEGARCIGLANVAIRFAHTNSPEIRTPIRIVPGKDYLFLLG